MRLSVFSYTNPGGRPNNEDAIRCDWNDQRGVFVLADGLGGHQSGEIASSLAADSMLASCASVESPCDETLSALFIEANEAIMDAQDRPNQRDMKTTAVTLVLEDGCAHWAHVGDSRLYHFSANRLAHVTRDHSVTYQKYLGGEISYMDICHDDDRSSLLRVLGKPGCHPACDSAAVQPGDAFLLCSDGFWEFVYNEEMLIDLLKASSPEEWAQLMLLRHIRRTPPGTDNFSLIAVFVEESP